MNTTNLFVELIVIGVGAFLWLLLLTGIISPELNNLLIKFKIDILSAIPVIAVIYVLGIITDKSVDGLFNNIFERNIRDKIFERKTKGKNRKGKTGKNNDDNDSLYFKEFYAKIAKSPDIAVKLDYIKSRIRIIRSWTVHFILIAVSLSFYIYLRSPFKLNQKITLMIFGSLILMSLSALSFFSWYYMTDTYFKKIKDIK